MKLIPRKDSRKAWAPGAGLPLNQLNTGIHVLFAADRQPWPGVVIDHSPAASGIYIGPSLAVLINGDYVASHDEFGPKSTEHSRAVSNLSIPGPARTGRRSRPLMGVLVHLFTHRGTLY